MSPLAALLAFFLVIALALSALFMAITCSFVGRCCFYGDGKHRCWRTGKWWIDRGAGHIDKYCDRHEKERLA